MHFRQGRENPGTEWGTEWQSPLRDLQLKAQNAGKRKRV